VARLILLLGFLSQAADIGWLCLRGLSPASEAREAVFFASWLIVGVYLLATLKSQLPVVGALILPVALILDVAARLAPPEDPHAATALRSVHIFSATLGMALFTVAAGGSVIYLLVERQLKRHHLGQLGRRGPALSTLDTLNRRTIFLGFLIFTIAIATGAVFMARTGPATLVQLLSRPQNALSLLTWLLYAGLLVLRATAGVRGRRAALLTLCGFATTLAVLCIYLLRSVLDGGRA
jgi:ABC-type uncharacterized transport system permease subunit